jgi:pyruvate,water dikinase
MRPERPDRAAAVELLDRFVDVVLEQWTIHFLAVVPAQIAIEGWSEAFTGAFPDERDPLAPYRLLDHLPNESTRADARLRSLARLARSLGVDDVLLAYPPNTAVERLRELELGRSFLARLDDYMSSYGGRARWHELSLPREAERPTMTLESLRLALEAGDIDEPRPRGREDGGAEAVRKALERAPALAGALEVAAFGYDLKESHVYDIDYPGLLATREVLLGYGRRLMAEGRLDALDDVWMLRRDELRSALTDGRDVRTTVIARADELIRGRIDGPAPFLGAAPEDVERPAVLEKFYGRASSSDDARLLRGIGASVGVAEGTVRVVLGVEDFARVRRGDVLVSTTTTPAWTPLFASLAALVTETGGVLSHAAIVAREYGVPTVVAVAGATRNLPDGARVRVDGGAGEVRLLDG